LLKKNSTENTISHLIFYFSPLRMFILTRGGCSCSSKTIYNCICTQIKCLFKR